MKRPLLLQILAFIVTRLVFNTMYRMAYPFLPFFVRGLGVDLDSMSRAMSIRSAAGMFSPFLAVIADLRGRKAGMLTGLALFVFGMLLVTAFPSFWTFAAALILTNIGYLTFIPAMQAYLGDRVPYHRRALPMALTELAWSLSFILLVPLAGWMIGRWGWNSPFPFLLGLSLVMLGVLAWQLPRDPVIPKGEAALGKKFSALLSPLALAGLSVGFLFNIGNESVNLLFGVWMEDRFGFQLAALGLVSIGIGFAELGGESLVGLLVDRAGKARSVAAGLLSNCLACLLLAGAARFSQPGIAVMGLLAFYLTYEFTIVSFLPLMSEALPQARATLLAANIAILSVGRAAGAWLAPYLFSWGGSTILVNALAAVCLNLLALGMLSFLKKVDQPRLPE